jgi:hypothetical protein
MNRPGFLIPVMACAIFFFGWKTYETWTRPQAAVRSLTAAGPVAPVGISPAEAPPAVDPSAAVASITARPLFRPDRRTFQDNAASSTSRDYEAELSRLTLLGVILLGDMKKAVITGKAPGRPERYEVAPGESLEGFAVKEILQDGVRLAADDKEFLLPLYAGSPKAQGSVLLRTELAPSPASLPKDRAGASTPPTVPPRGATETKPAASLPGAPPGGATGYQPPGPGTQPAPVYLDRRRIRPPYVPRQR